MNNTQKMTGYPSIDKPWMQWYGEETRHLPKCDNVNVYHNSKLVI